MINTTPFNTTLVSKTAKPCDTPLLSMIVPAYNVENYIAECLDSLLNQTLADIEIICINDGSTDSTPDIVNLYQKKDPRIVTFHQHNKGVSAARNKGLQLAKAPFILFCDADDTYKNNALELLYNAMITHNVDAVIGNTYIYDDRIESIHNAKLFSWAGTFEDGYIYISPEVFTVLGWSIGSRLYKKSLIDDFQISFPENTHYAEDQSFFFSYLAIASVLYSVHNAIYYYRKRKGSATDFVNRTISSYTNDSDTLIITTELHSLEHFYCFLQKYDKLREFAIPFFTLYTTQFHNLINTIPKKYIPKVFNTASRFLHNIHNIHELYADPILLSKLQSIQAGYITYITLSRTIMLEKELVCVYKKTISYKFQLYKYLLFATITIGKQKQKYQKKYNDLKNYQYNKNID